MKILHHAGGCCGIKVIANMDNRPDSQWLASSGHGDLEYLEVDRDGGRSDNYKNLYYEDRPGETGGDRFDAYLKFLRRVRPNGLIEVSIVTDNHVCNYVSSYASELLESGELESYEEAVQMSDQDTYIFNQRRWVPLLEERGFKCVTKFGNSNSSNEISVFHLVMTPDYELPHEKKKKKEK